VTRLLGSLTAAGVEVGATVGAESAELLPLVYAELRRLAGHQMNAEVPGQTLQPTALVHEAWLRLAGDDVSWNSKGHFFAAAGRAMRRILVERARAKHTAKRGDGARRVEFDDALLAGGEGDGEPGGDLLALDEALERLERHEARKAHVVHLRYFAGLTLEETAAALGVSLATVKADWSYARAWLFRELQQGGTQK